MGRVKKIGLVVLVGLLSYFLAVNVLMGLKVKGYRYLFRATEPYDLVVRNAVILDGTGLNAAFRGDLALRDGYIAALGYIRPKDSPVYDAGGLTVIPWPIAVEEICGDNTDSGDENGLASDYCTNILKHLLEGSYPRYPAEEIFFPEGPYRGLTLAQAACAHETTEQALYDALKKEMPPQTVVLLVSARYNKEDRSSEELLARLTGYRAELLGWGESGRIKEGCRADFYFFKSHDYSEDELRKLLLQGRIPQPDLIMEAGEIKEISQ